MLITRKPLALIFLVYDLPDRFFSEAIGLGELLHTISFTKRLPDLQIAFPQIIPLSRKLAPFFAAILRRRNIDRPALDVFLNFLKQLFG